MSSLEKHFVEEDVDLLIDMVVHGPVNVQEKAFNVLLSAVDKGHFDTVQEAVEDRVAAREDVSPVIATVLGDHEYPYCDYDVDDLDSHLGECGAALRTMAAIREK